MPLRKKEAFLHDCLRLIAGIAKEELTLMMRANIDTHTAARVTLSILSVFLFLSSCTFSLTPTYKKEEVAQAIQDISKREYNLDIKTFLQGKTLWMYIPVEDVFIKAEKPEKYAEKFSIEMLGSGYGDGLIKGEYQIKPVPSKEALQEYEYNKVVGKKVTNALETMRRVIFSMHLEEQKEIDFFCAVVADIKNGFEIIEKSYRVDMKKVSYGLISSTEYQHRSVQEDNISDTIKGDTEGQHLQLKDISLEEFVAAQIKHRIRLKFQKPEVQQQADIDEEIFKIAIQTISIYRPENLMNLELVNLLTESKRALNRPAIWGEFQE